jgi:hypothetical protein
VSEDRQHPSAAEFIHGGAPVATATGAPATWAQAMSRGVSPHRLRHYLRRHVVGLGPVAGQRHQQVAVRRVVAEHPHSK